MGRRSRSRAAGALTIALIAVLSAGSAAWAQTNPLPTRRPMIPRDSQVSLSGALFGERAPDGRRAAAPPVARYVAETGQTFVFDRTSTQPLVRFEGFQEIVVLQASPAPRGDVIYKNDTGQPVLRVSSLGGLTVFTNSRPQGAAAALDGPTSPIRLEVIRNAADLFNKLRRSAGLASRAAGANVLFDAPDVGPESSSLIADAANLTVEAFEKAAQRGRFKSLRISRVLLMEGQPPSATVEDDSLRIVVTPSQGIAGRPSSERIYRALWR